jgi:hypothetical protein
MSVTIDGLDSVLRGLEDLKRRAESLHGEHEVKIGDLLTPDFIQRFTDFMNVDEMFAASGFKLESQKDLEAIPQDLLDAFIRERTLFGCWSEMMQKATEEWTAKKLGL